MTDGYFLRPEDAKQLEIVPGRYRRTMATTDEAMLCEFFFERGTVVAEHSHMNDQVGYVVFGQLEVTIGDQIGILNPGDSYAVPGGVKHSFRALIDSLEIAVFSPPRHDFLTEAR
jgi:quercetin dioxygenase-like cupin family protein